MVIKITKKNNFQNLKKVIIRWGGIEMRIQDLLDNVLINQRLVLIDNSSSSYEAQL